MNLKTAALRLGVHYQTAYRWVRAASSSRSRSAPATRSRMPRSRGCRPSAAATERMPGRSSGRLVGGWRRAADEHRRRAARPRPDGRRRHARRGRGRRARRAGASPSISATPRSCIAGRPTSRGGRLRRAPGSGRRRSRRRPSGATRGPRRSRPPGAIARRVDLCAPGAPAGASPPPAPRAAREPPLVRLLQRGVRADRDAGALLVTRDLPGRPYTNDDLAFVESIAARVARADERARCWTAAWELRRAMVVAFSAPTSSGNCFDALSSGRRRPRRRPTRPARRDRTRRGARPGAAARRGSKAYAGLVGEDATRLTGVSLRSLVRDGGALDEALAPVLLGEIDFRSVELEVLGRPGPGRAARRDGAPRRRDAAGSRARRPLRARARRAADTFRASCPKSPTGVTRPSSTTSARRSPSRASARPRTRRRRGAPRARSAPRPRNARSPTRD